MVINDAVLLAIEGAMRGYGGNDRLFTAASFSNELTRLAGTEGVVDGRVVRVLLTGRMDVVPLGNGYYRLLQDPGPSGPSGSR